MHRGVVDEETVLILAMLPEGLAVIAEGDDQRRIVEAVLFEPSHQVAEFVIGVGNLAIVGVIAVLRPVRFRRIVRTMRIVKMQPEKKRPSWSFFQPRNGMRHAL